MMRKINGSLTDDEKRNSSLTDDEKRNSSLTDDEKDTKQKRVLDYWLNHRLDKRRVLFYVLSPVTGYIIANFFDWSITCKKPNN